MSRIKIDWEEIEPIYGPPCPDFCDDFEDHLWTINVEERMVFVESGCAICDRGMMVTDMAQYLTGGFKAKLRGESVSYGYYEPEYEYYLHIEPTGENDV